MQRRRLAIVGLGRLGQACAHAILESDDLALAGFVRRAETVLNPLPTQLAGIPAVSHPSELGAVDAVLICLPTELVCEVAAGLLRHHTPIFDAATLDGIARQEHWRAIDRMALRRGVPAAVGAGWNPGIRPLFEGLFAALCPKGGTRIHDRPGVSLHHTLAAQAIPGVRDALCAEMRGVNGAVQRYVYVELTPGADLEPAAEAIRSDPLFLDEETLVLPVDSVATLEEEGHGLVIERWGHAGGKDHQRFLLEGRFDRIAVAGQTMVSAARALATLRPGAHPLDTIPPASLHPQSIGKDA
jgi:diaminopimelate dehydrogenase